MYKIKSISCQQKLCEEMEDSGYMNREEVLKFVKENYGTEPEFLWKNYPNYIVFRHPNKKWYGIVMDVSKKSLGLGEQHDNVDGLEGNDKIDILDVKCTPEIAYAFRDKSGFLPAYHMNKDSWLTLRLDGSLDADTIKSFLDQSYSMLDKA